MSYRLARRTSLRLHCRGITLIALVLLSSCVPSSTAGLHPTSAQPPLHNTPRVRRALSGLLLEPLQVERTASGVVVAGSSRRNAAGEVSCGVCG